MNYSNYLSIIALSTLSKAPVFVAWLVGMVIAFVRWPRHPGVSLLTAISLGAMAAITFLGRAISTTLPIYLIRRGMAAYSMTTLVTGTAILVSIFEAICWVMLFVALFHWRARPVATETPRIGSTQVS